MNIHYNIGSGVVKISGGRVTVKLAGGEDEKRVSNDEEIPDIEPNGTGRFDLNKKNLRRLAVVVIIIGVISVAEFTLFVYGQFSDVAVDDNPVFITRLEDTGVYPSGTRYDNYTLVLEMEVANRGRIPAEKIEIKSWLRMDYGDVAFATIQPGSVPAYDIIGVLDKKSFNLTFSGITVYDDSRIEFHLEVLEDGEVTERANATLKDPDISSFVHEVELEVDDLVQRNSSIFFIAVGLEAALVLVTILLSVFITGDRKLALAISALGLAPLFRIVNVATPLALDFLVFVTMSYGFLLVAVFIFIHVNRITWTDLGVTFKNAHIFIPLAVLIGFILAPLEFWILGPPAWIPTPTVYNIIILTLVMIFFVGLAEELMFRALIQTSLERLLSPRLGLILTSVLFGIMHGVWTSYMELVFTFAAGMLFGYLFQRTRNLPFIAVLHGVEDVILFGLLPFIL